MPAKSCPFLYWNLLKKKLDDFNPLTYEGEGGLPFTQNIFRQHILYVQEVVTHFM